MNKFIVDAFEFCRLNELRDGVIAIAEMPRLTAESPTDQRSINWSIVGGADQVGHAQLTVVVKGVISLICQRCLGAVDFQIESSSTLVLAHSEQEADEIEALLANDAVDVVAVDKKLDIAELIEDEILLAIPQSTKHAVCPTDAITVLDAAKKPSAFAALKDLKL